MTTHTRMTEEGRTITEEVTDGIIVNRFTYLDADNWTSETFNPANGLPREAEENKLELVTVGAKGQPLKTPYFQRVNTRRFCDGNGIKRTELVQINDEEKEIVRLFRENGTKDMEYEYGPGRLKGTYTSFDENEDVISSGNLIKGGIPNGAIELNPRIANIVSSLKK